MQRNVRRNLRMQHSGKDPGFTPELLLDQAARHSAYAQADLDRLRRVVGARAALREGHGIRLEDIPT